MNNAEKFKQIFGLYATELWSMPESDFLEWLNRDVETTQIDHTADIGKKAERTAETAQNTSSCAHENDLVFREAAIEALARMMPRAYTPDGSHPADEEIFRAQEVIADCIEALEILTPAQPELKWIPCSERLPYAEYGESDNVLATCGYRDVEDGSIRWIKTLYFNGGNWCYPTGETYLEKVYAWQPLPEPYQGGDSE